MKPRIMSMVNTVSTNRSIAVKNGSSLNSEALLKEIVRGVQMAFQIASDITKYSK